ncbi:hypothetical protein D3C78_1428610 [compost metagenome]
MIERYGIGVFILRFTWQHDVQTSIQNRHERSVNGTSEKMCISVGITSMSELFEHFLRGNLQAAEYAEDIRLQRLILISQRYELPQLIQKLGSELQLEQFIQSIQRCCIWWQILE